MTAASPGVIASTFPTSFYPSHEAYLDALAAALAHEYRAITGAGLVLQVDCPDLAMDRQLHFADAPPEAFRRHVQQSVAALNKALTGIPPELVRVHVCHGNYPGTHHRDIPLGDILDLLLEIPCQALSVVAANGQHRETTYQAIKRFVAREGWPTGRLLIPGCIDTLTSVEEHPETVAGLIEQYAALIGRENVLAGTDCGFGTIVGVFEQVVPSAVWSRLAVLSQGARIATARLWQEQAAVV